MVFVVLRTSSVRIKKELLTHLRFGGLAGRTITAGTRSGDGDDCLRGVKAFSGLGEILGAFRFHRLRPSRRNSLMKPVRSR